MTLLRNNTLAMAIAAILMFATVAAAGEKNQTPDSAGFRDPSFRPQMGPGPGPGGPMHGPFGDPSKQRKHLEQLRMLKMLELLNLTAEQEVPFLTAFNQMRIEQRNLEEKSDALLDSMATEMAATKPGEARLKTLIAGVKACEKQRFEQFFAFADKVEALLTTEQIAKLLIFQKRFEMELLEQIGRFRRGGPGGRGGSSDDDGY